MRDSFSTENGSKAKAPVRGYPACKKMCPFWKFVFLLKAPELGVSLVAERSFSGAGGVLESAPSSEKFLLACSPVSPLGNGAMEDCIPCSLECNGNSAIEVLAIRNIYERLSAFTSNEEPGEEKILGVSG